MPVKTKSKTPTVARRSKNAYYEDCSQYDNTGTGALIGGVGGALIGGASTGNAGGVLLGRSGR